MQVFLIVVVLIGTPFWLWNQVTSGAFDAGSFGLGLFIIVCAIGGLWVKVQRARVAQAQQDFWLNQKR